LRLLALATAAGVLAFGSVGLVLAINGWYRPALAFPIGATAWLALLALARPVIASPTPTSRSVHIYAAVGVAAVLAITTWNAAHASQHVLINRDGGDYANTGRWIARDGSLTVKPRVGPFANEPTVGFESFGIYQMKDGTLQFQFAHLLPVVLAEAYAIGGNTGLFHAPEVLGGIALLAFFVLAWRLFRRPLFALSAMLALAFVIPQVSFSRDSYSEIPSQILVFTAIWVLVTPRLLPRWRIALLSGLFLGALEAVRIDGVAFLIGVPVLLAAAWLRARGEEDRREVLRSILAFVAGLVPGMLLGYIDLSRHSGMYWSDLYHNVLALVLLAVASAVVCTVAAVVGSRRGVVDAVRRLPWSALATLAGVLVGVVGFVAWFVRPHIQHLHGSPIGLVGGLQGAEHVAVDATRTYFERSMVWMSWYLGPLALALAIIGAAFLARELLLGRRLHVLVALAVFAPDAMLYLYKASAVPDQIWVTRRFLVSTIPLLLLLALGFAAAVAERRSSMRFGVAARVGAMVFAISAIVYPLYTVIGVQSMSEERGFVQVIDDVCHEVGPHAAVVVLERDETDLYDDWVLQAIRSWCGAEVGVTRGGAHADALLGLAASWKAQGKPLFVVAKSDDTISKVLPDVTPHLTRTVVNSKFLEQTLTHRPDEYVPQAFALAVARVPAA
jgi:hypothetical protein